RDHPASDGDPGSAADGRADPPDDRRGAFPFRVGRGRAGARDREHRDLGIPARGDDRQPIDPRRGLPALPGQGNGTQPGDRMTGLVTLVFAAALALIMVLVYAAGMTGWLIGMGLTVVGLAVTAFTGWCDLATVAVQALAGGVVLWLSMRWTLSHRSW